MSTKRRDNRDAKECLAISSAIVKSRFQRQSCVVVIVEDNESHYGIASRTDNAEVRDGLIQTLRHVADELEKGIELPN